MYGVGSVSPLHTEFLAEKYHYPEDQIIFLPGGVDTSIFYKQENAQKLIKESSLAFWDAYLKSDGDAKAWLNQDFDAVLGAAGTFEQK